MISKKFQRIDRYIIDNPVNWKIDRDNLENLLQLPPPEKVEDYLEDIEQLMEHIENQG